MKRTYTAVWGILGFGLLGLLLLGSLGLWTQRSGVVLVQSQLRADHGLEVESLEVLREAGKVVGVKLHVIAEERLSEAVMEAASLDAFALFLDGYADDDLSRVVLETTSGQTFELPRMRAIMYGDAQRERDKLVLWLIRVGALGAEVKVVGVDDSGAALRVEVESSKDLPLREESAIKLERRLRLKPNVQLGVIEVELRAPSGDARLLRRFDGRGRIIAAENPAPPPTKAPNPSSPDATAPEATAPDANPKEPRRE